MKRIYKFTIEDHMNYNMNQIQQMAQEAAEDHLSYRFCASEGKDNIELLKVELEGIPVQKDEKTIVYSFVAWGYENEKFMV